MDLALCGGRFDIRAVNRFHASLIVLALWAAIFLPGLGSVELKGEEGRRILPAITMLDTGHWVVPYVGGKPFLRKPPLVNWMIAGAMKALGVRNEWTVRLPSVLAVLGLGLCIVSLGGDSRWMSVETALIAAIFTLTQLSMLEKGRIAEIDAIYTALSGAAIAAWSASWIRGDSPWRLWLVPFLLLGFALLAKGPLHLLFFYAVVISVAWHAREWRTLLHPAHFAGILLMLGIFALWWFPYHRDPATLQAGQVWQKQMEDRINGQFHFSSWALNIPRGLSDRLPWVFFAPLLWRRDLEKLGLRDGAFFRGVRLAVVVCFFGLLLFPGVLPRYTMPLSVPFALLLAIALSDSRMPPPSPALRFWWRTNSALAGLLLFAACAAPVALAIAERRHFFSASADESADFAMLIAWPIVGSAGALVLCLVVLVGRRKLARPSLIACASGALIAAAMFLYASSGTPFQRKTEVLRPSAAVIDRFMAPQQSLTIYDPEYQPVIFYLHVPYSYALSAESIPSGAPWVLCRKEKLDKLRHEHPDLEVAHEFQNGKLPQLVLLHRTPKAN